MSFASHRVTNAWRNFQIDPCAKTMLAVTRLISQHQYDSAWPCHDWIKSGLWRKSPWFARWHSALLSSLRTSCFSASTHDDILFSRLCAVAQWTEQDKTLKNIVRADAICPFEWWMLGAWMDNSSQSVDKMPEFVAMWDPIWALAAPLYLDLGWQKGLQALHRSVAYQKVNTVEKIDGSIFCSID